MTEMNMFEKLRKIATKQDEVIPINEDIERDNYIEAQLNEFNRMCKSIASDTVKELEKDIERNGTNATARVMCNSYRPCYNIRMMESFKELGFAPYIKDGTYTTHGRNAGEGSSTYKCKYIVIGVK